MVGGNKAPVARVLGVVAVVAHHEVVILLESVGSNCLSVDADAGRRQHHIFIVFVAFDDGAVHGNRFFVDWDCGT